MTTEQTLQPDTASVRRPWYRSLTISLSAFVMFITGTAISAFHALRGPEIDVLAPKQIVLYRDATGSSPVPTAVLSFDMINDSADHGDFILGASLMLGVPGPTYPFNGSVRFGPGEKVNKITERCTFGASCVPVQGFLIETTPETLIPLPQGSARSVTLSFPLDPAACSGAACDDYMTFDKALGSLNGKPTTFTVTIHLHTDGERTISCRTGRLNMTYLRRSGFTSTSCEETYISGASFF